jgi:hypothetical protein
MPDAVPAVLSLTIDKKDRKNGVSTYLKQLV